MQIKIRREYGRLKSSTSFQTKVSNRRLSTKSFMKENLNTKKSNDRYLIHHWEIQKEKTTLNISELYYGDSSHVDLNSYFLDRSWELRDPLLS